MLKTNVITIRQLEYFNRSLFLSFRFKISFCKCFQFHFSYISIELDQDEERASMGFGSADDYYSDAFDYYDDAARAGTIIFTTFEI